MGRQEHPRDSAQENYLEGDQSKKHLGGGFVRKVSARKCLLIDEWESIRKLIYRETICEVKCRRCIREDGCL